MPASQAGRRRFDPGHPLHFLPGLRPVKCPTCSKDFERKETEFPPFCSERCKLIDLGRWMNEEYSIPGEPASPADLVDAVEPDEKTKH